MNTSLLGLEITVAQLGIAVLLLSLWIPAARHRQFGYGVVAATATLLGYAFLLRVPHATVPVGTERLHFEWLQYAFGTSYVLDSLAVFFKRFFLAATVLVMLLATQWESRLREGYLEYFALLLFALLGMMLTASANDFTVMFVSIELITVTFYVLTSFERRRTASLEAGVKYLILGALASAFMVFGMALVYGSAGTMAFTTLASKSAALRDDTVFVCGLLLILAGLGFKLAAVPFQIWAPDVYEGAPTPTTAFLALGSKAAGLVVLWRLFLVVVPEIGAAWSSLWIGVAAVTILYGNLCAIPQRNLKRLLGYSSIANAGYLLIGVAAMNSAGTAAILYYLCGYLFTLGTAFAVLIIVSRDLETEDVSIFEGLHRRSPLLAAAMTLAMVSLAGVPPLAGFLGKFLLFRAALEHPAVGAAHPWLLGVAIVGVLISFYYYFGIIRAMYWPRTIAPTDTRAVTVSLPARITLSVCIAGMLILGTFPRAGLWLVDEAARMLRLG